MKSIKDMTNVELAAFVQNHLKEKGIDVVLSDGACVSFYSKYKYVSMDLDLINTYFAKRRDIRESMEKIGFSEEGRHFVHPDTNFYVEFPPGPLAIGEEPIKEVDEIKLDTGLLRIISVTDCVKDRLAAYYQWNDLQCLEQACMVALNSKIDLKEVERWSRREDKLDGFRRFLDEINEKEIQS